MKSALFKVYGDSFVWQVKYHKEAGLDAKEYSKMVIEEMEKILQSYIEPEVDSIKSFSAYCEIVKGFEQIIIERNTLFIEEYKMKYNG